MEKALRFYCHFWRSVGNGGAGRWNVVEKMLPELAVVNVNDGADVGVLRVDDAVGERFGGGLAQALAGEMVLSWAEGGDFGAVCGGEGGEMGGLGA